LVTAKKEGSIAIPTGNNVGKSLQNYGVGLAAGLGFNLVSRFTGSGLVGGAIAAGVTGAIVPGEAGKIITTTLGFNLGSRGFENLGIGNLGQGLNGLFGTAQQQKTTQGPTFALI